jgi:hypothetical protein
LRAVVYYVIFVNILEQKKILAKSYYTLKEREPLFQREMFNGKEYYTLKP